jgi:tungstate transport system ATP-binding protein
MMFELHNLTRQYGGNTVLSLPRLSFSARKIYALRGANGAGKSTLLNLLALLDRPSAGTIRFRGEPVVYESAALTRMRRRIVLVDQNPIMFTGTVWSNVEYGLKVRKLSAKQREPRVTGALERVDMRAFATADARTLSGGEGKRVALARALALDPEVLLCDEPTANVDREHQEAMLKILVHANELNHTTIIFATHDISHSNRIAHETVVLQHGRVNTDRQLNWYGVHLRKTEGGSHQIVFAENAVLETGPFPAGISYTRGQRVHLSPHLLSLQRPGWAEYGNGKHPNLPGTITGIQADKAGIRVVVDVAVSIDVLLSSQEYESFRPSVGERILVEVPPDAVIFDP